MLDCEEYFHLALDATKKQDHKTALENLHKALEQDPGHANSLYLLGAEYAELDMTDRAIEAIEKALKFDPSIQLAYFQLALLYMKLDKKTETGETLQKLQDNCSDKILLAYSEGLKLINEEERDAAIESIQTTLGLPQAEGYLNETMRSILSVLHNTQKPSGQTQENPQIDQAAEAPSSLYHLDAYKKTNFKEDDD